MHNRRKDGSLYWESAVISTLCDDEGHILHYIGVKENVTMEVEAIEHANKVLKESEIRFRSYSRPASSDQVGVRGLTDREFEIFKLLGSGLPTETIANRLHLSPKTVDSHRANIKTKLKISKMSALIAFSANWIAGEERLRG